MTGIPARTQYMVDWQRRQRLMRTTTYLSLAAAAAAWMVLGCGEKEPEPGIDTGHLRVLGRSGEVSLKANLEKEKKTVFDFYTDSCGVCIALMPTMIRLDRERDDVRVVVVDITPSRSTLSEDSPIWEETGLLTIPHTPYYIIFSPDGRMRARGEEANAIVHHWLQELD